MPSQSSPPLRTSADDLLELIRRRGKLSVDDAAKTLKLPVGSVQSIIDFLVEEKMVGIEYKFTTPYVYLNEQKGIGPTPLLGASRQDPAKANPDQIKSEGTSTAEIATLVTGIRLLLENKQYDQVEDAYDSLWKKMAGSDLTWDKGLFEEFSAINEQIAKTMGALYEEFKVKSLAIRQQMSQAQAFLAAKRVDEAFALYSPISSQLEGLPSLLYQEKKALERDVLRLYRDIHEAQGQSDSQKAAFLSRSISEQASRTRPYLLSGNILLAKEHYRNLLGLYSQLPSGFLPLKNSIARELAQMYKSLAIQIEIESLRSQLHPLTQKKAEPNQMNRREADGGF